MVDCVWKGRHCCTRKSPPETSSDHATECPDVVLLELSLLAEVTDAGNYVLILISVEHPVDLEPFVVKLLSIPLDISYQYGILKLGHLLICPKEGQVRKVDNIKVRLPEACLTFGPLMPDETD